MAEDSIRVLAWSERTEPKEVYPEGINGAVARLLNGCKGVTAVTSALSDPEQGVSRKALDDCDVLVWFGHMKHEKVSDETVERIVKAVKENGMGFLGLHSTHFARPYRALMGTTCAWRTYVEDGKSALIRVVSPEHPIAEGVSEFTIPQEEWYGEPYDVPEPEAVIIEGIYNDGKEVARDGLVWTVGKGRVFYFRPGHETYPIYFMPQVQRILENGVRWLAGARRENA
ncbi:MAG: ThuA domain-containing protein [Armatimonadetes bacterium]|nr:ThuA domain-containing protein [Armatimonadota bacterium]